MEKIHSVEEYIDKNQKWKKELSFLRQLLIETVLEEGIKWSFPVYMLNRKNVLGIACFKEYVGIWFFQGVFLNDPKAILVNAQEGKTKAMRQWRFKNLGEIVTSKNTIKNYIEESISNHLDGLEIKPDRKKKEIAIPLLLQNRLKGTIKKNFENFSPYKQREFCDYIAEAKREETKHRRLEKIIPMIEAGIGLSDKYRK